MYNSIFGAVLAHSKNTPDKMIVADCNERYSYCEMIATVMAVSDKIKELGVSCGDYLLVECTQQIEFLVIDLACQYLGVVFVPVEKKAVEERVAKIYTETQAKVILGRSDYSSVGNFVDLEGFVEKVTTPFTAEIKEPERDVLGEILFSTGTTGEPKGICISNGANVAVAQNIQYGTEMTAESVEMIPLPLSHSHGLRTCYANFLNGSAVVIIDGIMNVSLFFKMFDEYGVNAIDISPTLAKLLMKIAKKGLVERSSLVSYIEIGTAVLDEETKEKLKVIFPDSRLYNFYGSTEAGRSCVLNFNETDFASCIGYPSKNSSFKIVDDDRHEMVSSKDNPGLIAVSGSMMMDGYFNAKELTEKTVVDGVIYTNDLGYIDEEGRVYVLGRKDDVINYKGIKIAPEEIEVVAMKFDGVNDCACVPMADKICGQAPKLFIAVSDEETFDMKTYQDFLKDNLEISRIPKQIVIIEKIPKSSNGKTKRKELLDL